MLRELAVHSQVHTKTTTDLLTAFALADCPHFAKQTLLSCLGAWVTPALAQCHGRGFSNQPLHSGELKEVLSGASLIDEKLHREALGTI